MTETNIERRRAAREAKQKKKKKLHKILGIVLICVCVMTAVVAVAAILSSDTYRDEDTFRDYASSYFSQMDEDKDIGSPQEVIRYGTPVSTAMEYPVTGQEIMDGYIRSIAKDLENQFRNENKSAGKDDQVAMLMDYNMYQSEREAVSLVFTQEQRKEEKRKMETVSSEIYTYNFSTETGAPLTAIQIFHPGYKDFCSEYLTQYFTDKYKDKLAKNYEKVLSNAEENLNKFVLTKKGVRFYFEPGTVLNEEEGAVTAEIRYKDLEGVIRNQIEIRAIDPSKPMVALTFDDGPFPKTTGRILNCMEKYGVVATFFELGQNIAAYPDVVKREADLGMEIGSHSWSHPNFKEISEKKAKEQIAKTNQALIKACGQKATVFRPPYGNNTKSIEKNAGAPIILWSVDTLDWKSRNAKSVMKVVKGVKNLDGRVILMHSIYDSSAEAVEKMVPWLLEKGYQLVTVSELLKYKYNETPVSGKLYGYGYFYMDK